MALSQEKELQKEKQNLKQRNTQFYKLLKLGKMHCELALWAYSPGQFLELFYITLIYMYTDIKHKAISDHLPGVIMKHCILLFTLKMCQRICSA